MMHASSESPLGPLPLLKIDFIVARHILCINFQVSMVVTDVLLDFPVKQLSIKVFDVFTKRQSVDVDSVPTKSGFDGDTNEVIRHLQGELWPAISGLPSVPQHQVRLASVGLPFGITRRGTGVCTGGLCEPDKSVRLDPPFD